jgi:F0F1-type ATP synthase assembly protein I
VPLAAPSIWAFRGRRVSEHKPESRSQLAFYAELSQIGIEMAAPIGIGAWLDSYLGWSPWLVITGAIVGFAGGMLHLLSLVNRPPPSREPPK